MVLGSGIRDPRSGIRDPEKTYSGSRIPDPGVKKHPIPDPGSRIRIRNTDFCLMMEGYGSGFLPVTNGTGSGRLKNLRIRNTELRILVLIHSTFSKAFGKE
jgi:hypothetical protein